MKKPAFIRAADPAGLRRRAEARLSDRRKARPVATDPVRTLHELEVHQIELEMQNTELQKARNELEIALEKFTDLYDFAPVGYFSLDEKGVILEANLMGAALLGVERSRLIKRRLQGFVVAESQPNFLAFLDRVFAATGKQACEAAILKEDANPFWASLHGTCALTASEPRKWCRVAVSDITSRKLAEEVLRRNEALFSALIQQVPVGVYVVDGQLRLQQVNPTAQPIFNNVQPLTGRNLSEIMHILWPAKTAAEVVEHFRQTLKTGKPYYSSEFSERRHDSGVMESYEWQLQRITLPAGQFGVVCFFTDITGRKLAEATQRRIAVLAASNRKLEQEIVRRQAVEEALQKSEQHQRALLEDAHQMQEQLRHLSRQVLRAQEEERKRISRELHDQIAQSLTAINVQLATLKAASTINTKDLQQKIARTQHLVEKSVDIIHQFARELRPMVLDDLGVIPALHSYMKIFSKRTGIHIRFTASNSRRIAQLDTNARTVLYRVMQEALLNVDRHAHASRVNVSLQKLSRGVALTIQDNGKSFQVKQLLDTKLNKRLGLLGMRERVEMVGGRLLVESAPGNGTTIRAEIPFTNGKARGGGEMTPLPAPKGK
jgi:PAS domain S-box-containing protein